METWSKETDKAQGLTIAICSSFLSCSRTINRERPLEMMRIIFDHDNIHRYTWHSCLTIIIVGHMVAQLFQLPQISQIISACLFCHHRKSAKNWEPIKSFEPVIETWSETDEAYVVTIAIGSSFYFLPEERKSTNKVYQFVCLYVCVLVFWLWMKALRECLGKSDT